MQDRAVTASDASRNQVVAVALAQVGTPYRFGGDTPRGFDCSGLARYAHGAAEIRIPRQTHVQSEHARRVDISRLKPGDLLFFRIDDDKPSHVSIYVGENRFVHAPSSGGHVHVERLDHPYWAPRLLHAGHFFAE
ncbi:Nlp family transcriptional regulator [Thioalkalivibrio denitrificans]|uniref:Nlp family transcriptional regulator n=1 Tax=Thioalkalivibrio denitrificans TaxID=108003 RepID=A0A1V3NLG6_9GAMM|nr:Nlp family transcriptional regulator [Thioalkalivibrio denitrificans]